MLKSNVEKMMKCGYSPEKGRRVCELVSAGYTLLQIIEKGVMNREDNVLQWCKYYPDFRHEYKESLQMNAHHFAFQTIDIADASDISDKDKAMMIKARQWVASKHAPDLYETKHIAIQQDQISTLTLDQIEAKKTQLLERLKVLTDQQKEHDLLLVSESD